MTSKLVKELILAYKRMNQKIEEMLEKDKKDDREKVVFT